MINHLISLVSDQNCIVCGASRGQLCSGCVLTEIEYIPEVCVICNKVSPEYKVCGGCRREFKLSNIYCIGMYEGALKQVVRNMKFDCNRSMALDIAKLVEGHLSIYLKEFQTVVAVPSIAAAKRQRGFDVSEELAKAIASGLSVPDKRLLQKSSNSGQQKYLKMADRRAARKTKMYRKRSRWQAQEVGRILLIDDILTTGSTLAAAADVLRAEGVQDVSAVVVARTPWSY